MSQQYNGWTNYETWLIYTWLSNDSATDAAARLMVAANGQNIHSDDALKEYVEQLADELMTGPSSFVNDFVSHGIGQVDWRAITTAYKPTIPDGTRCECCEAPATKQRPNQNGAPIYYCHPHYIDTHPRNEARGLGYCDPSDIKSYY